MIGRRGSERHARAEDRPAGPAVWARVLKWLLLWVEGSGEADVE